jgi:hypothetical protein
MSEAGHGRCFREIRDESGLHSTPERLRQRSEPTLSANKRHCGRLAQAGLMSEGVTGGRTSSNQGPFTLRGPHQGARLKRSTRKSRKYPRSRDPMPALGIDGGKRRRVDHMAFDQYRLALPHADGIANENIGDPCDSTAGDCQPQRRLAAVDQNSTRNVDDPHATIRMEGPLLGRWNNAQDNAVSSEGPGARKSGIANERSAQVDLPKHTELRFGLELSYLETYLKSDRRGHHEAPMILVC